MNLLPEDQAAAHLDPIMYAAHESGLPVPCSIPPHNVKRFILSDICMAEVLEIDHETIHDSYLLAKASGKSWGPWWIARLLMDKRTKEYDARMDADRQAARDSKVKPKILTGPERDYLCAVNLLRSHTHAQRKQIVAQVQARTGRAQKLTYLQAYIIRAKHEREKA